MSFLGDLQQLDCGARVELFELDARAIGGEQVYFHAGTNEFNTGVVWQGVTYLPFPVRGAGFEWDSSKPSRPKLAVANVTGLITALTQELNDLVNARVVRRCTKVRYLDAANFVAGNPEADPDEHWPDEVWYITQKLNETRDVIEFELGSPLDLQGVMLPRRQVLSNVCPWQYRGEGCGYAGDPVADALDQPTSDPLSDKCSKRLTGCVLRFGDGVLPYGAFPGSALVTR